VEVVVGLVPALLVFSHTESVNGWDVGLVVAVTGMFQIMTALLGAFVLPNQAKMTDYVRRGELDLVLIRPISAQWYAACRWVQPAELWSSLAGLGLVIAGLAHADVQPAAGDVLLGLGWFFAGLVLVTLIWINLGYLAFWLESADPIPDLMWTLLAAGRYPLAFFPSAVRTVLTFVIPVGLATTVPIAALTGQFSLSLALRTTVVIVLLAALTRIHWVAALRRYASASS
jgi:ABC-2 type transport system permease protein